MVQYPPENGTSPSTNMAVPAAIFDFHHYYFSLETSRGVLSKPFL